MEVKDFNGFSKKGVTFFKNLRKNNSKVWFEKNRENYEKSVMEPSRDFVVAMGKKLEKIAPDITADPRVNRSLFKIYRDVRFSKDKSPFKTNMGIWLWEGDRKRMENSGFYFHLDPPNIMVGVGLYMFPKPHLAAYRKAVLHKTLGPALVKTIKAVEKKGYETGFKHYKMVPRGFDKNHKLADYLLYNGLVAMMEMKIPEEFYNKELIGFCYNHFKKMLPVHKWLLEMMNKMM